MISEEKSYLCSIFILYVIDDLIDAYMGNLGIMNNFLKSIKSAISIYIVLRWRMQNGKEKQQKERQNTTEKQHNKNIT